MKLLNTKGVIDMLKLIKDGTVSTLRDEYDNVIALNWVGNSTGIACAKYVMGHLTVGANEEERAADEAALRKFIEEWNNVDVLHILNVALKLNKDKLTEDDVESLKRELAYYVEANKEVVRVEVPVREAAPVTTNTCRGKYPSLFENLYALDVETLKEMKRQANRNGASDLKNACRTVLRHKGVNC